MDAFCNVSEGDNASLWTALWTSGAPSDCGALVVAGATHGLLFLSTLAGLCAQPTHARSTTPAAALRAAACLGSGLGLLACAVLSAYSGLALPSTLAWVLEGGVWVFGAGLWLSAGPRRPGLPLLALVWSAATAALSVDAWREWRRPPGPFIPPILVGAAAVQTLYLSSLVLDCARAFRQRHFVPRQRLDESDGQDGSLGAGEDSAGWGSELLFLWTGPLLRRGWDGRLESTRGLFSLPAALDVAGVEATFAAAAQAQPTLLRGLLAAFGREYFALGGLKLIGDMLSFSGPILLHYIVGFVSSPSEAAWHGYAYAAALFAGSLSSAAFGLHFNFRITKVGLKIRSTLITAVYGKMLRLTQSRLNDSNFKQGELMNLMSTDTDRVVNFCPSFHEAWGLPLQLGLALALLYREVGLAFLAGIGFAVLLVPVNKWIMAKIGRYSTEMMRWKDRRVNMMTELLGGIRSVKLSAWEPKYYDKIQEVREQELKYLKGRKYLDAGCVYLWASAPSLIALFTFLSLSLMGKELGAASVFTTLSLLGILIRPLNAFPWVLNGLVEAAVSLRRLQAFLRLPDVALKDRLHLLSPQEKPRILRAQGLCLSWLSNDSTPRVAELRLTISPGELIGVVGSIGSGKSSLLSGLLGELHVSSGSLSLSAGVLEEGAALAGQEAWLEAGTLQENVLWGSPFEPERYQRALFVCALRADLSAMAEGDATWVGEGGATLSGGQRARVALARAVYQRAPLYLLDDPLSAVDAGVAEHIFRECIQGELLRRGSAVVLVTHHVRFLKDASQVLRLDSDGVVQHKGSGAEFLKSLGSSTTISGDRLVHGHSTSAGREVPGNTETPISQDEEKETGRVSWHIYGIYANFIGTVLSTCIFLALLSMQGTKNATDWWLAYWVGHESHNTTTTGLASLPVLTNAYNSYPPPVGILASGGGGRPVSFYLGVFGALTAANSVATLFRAFLFAYGGVVAARKTHNRLLSTILQAKMSFFDRTPLGRLVNRFSSDLYAVDETLPFQGNIFLMFVFGVLGTLATIAIGLPWFIICIAVLAILYFLIQRYYRQSTCDLKRLCSISLSPIYAQFSESLAGATTIRAARQIPRYSATMRAAVSESQRANYATLAASLWLGMRLQGLGVVVVASVAVLAVVQHHAAGGVDPGLVGLGLAYALSVTGILSGLLSSFTETEKELVSLERISEYVSQAPQEEDNTDAQTPPDWPSQGGMEFEDVTLRYGSGMPAALDSVSFDIRPGQRVGVVGRTGSGKSSLLAALLRTTELESGRVSVDGVSVCDVGLSELRSRLAVIPQSPFLLSASFRDNVDMFGEYADERIGEVVRLCGLESVVWKVGGLGGWVGERGSLLSVGERQLVCLARAALCKAKIVCLDEATAHVDAETDALIQTVLCGPGFGGATLLSIAHRLDSLRGFDRILVLDRGRLVADGTPEQLIARAAHAHSKTV